MPERFSWIVPETLAGMERPGLFYPLDEDLEFLRKMKIDVIINLEEYYRTYKGFESKHIPIDDFQAPKLDDFIEFVKFVQIGIQEGKSIAVHCYAGMGRTNLMLSSYLLYHMGMKPATALEYVKQRRPVHLVNEAQIESLEQYYYTIAL